MKKLINVHCVYMGHNIYCTVRVCNVLCAAKLAHFPLHTPKTDFLDIHDQICHRFVKYLMILSELQMLLTTQQHTSLIMYCGTEMIRQKTTVAYFDVSQ